jgi:hypothetical protein
LVAIIATERIFDGYSFGVEKSLCRSRFADVGFNALPPNLGITYAHPFFSLFQIGIDEPIHPVLLREHERPLSAPLG